MLGAESSSKLLRSSSISPGHGDTDGFRGQLPSNQCPEGSVAAIHDDAHWPCPRSEPEKQARTVLATLARAAGSNSLACAGCSFLRCTPRRVERDADLPGQQTWD